MDCPEARSLLDRGIRPGAQSQQSAQLGFHLARCSACRAYRDQTSTLLDSLLLQTEAACPVSVSPRVAQYADAPGSEAVAAQPGNQNRSLSSVLRWPGAFAALLVVVFLFWTAGVAMRANSNIDAMIITPVPTLAYDRVAIDNPGITPVVPPETTVLTPTYTATPAPPSPTDTPATTATTTVHATATSPLPVRTTAPTRTATPQLPTPPPLYVNPTPQELPSIGPPPPGTTPPAVLAAAPPTPYPTPAVAGAGPINVLLLGIDRRPHEPPTAGPRTDAIMLVRLDPQQQRIALLSLPRDLWVPIPGYYNNRINAAYPLGERSGIPGMGLELTRATVSNLMDVPIHYVMMIDFAGFTRLIDTIGGITVDVEEELHDDHFPTMDYGITTVHFLPGPQIMDGYTALTYSRIRHPDSDFKRTQRQQVVMMSIGRRLRERGDLQNLLTADALTGALADYVRTDIPKERIMSLAWAFRNYDLTRIERYAIDGTMVTSGVGNDVYALVPYQPSIDRLAELFMYGR